MRTPREKGTPMFERSFFLFRRSRPTNAVARDVFLSIPERGTSGAEGEDLQKNILCYEVKVAGGGGIKKGGASSQKLARRPIFLVQII